jgi:hypothetical protein
MSPLATENEAAIEFVLGEALERLERLLSRVESPDGPRLTREEIGALTSTYEHAQYHVAELEQLVRRLRTSLRKRERAMCKQAVQAAKAARASADPSGSRLQAGVEERDLDEIRRVRPLRGVTSPEERVPAGDQQH